MVDLDLTCDYGPLTLKNPVVSSASEIIMDDKGVEKAVKIGGVGGIVTKSFTGDLPPVLKSVVRPGYFPMRKRFGTAYETAWMLGSAGFLARPPEIVIERYIPRMLKLCKEAEIPLIVSIINLDPEKFEYWASRFAETGIDALELDLQCPDVSRLFPIENHLKWGEEVVRRVSNVVDIPVIPKIGFENNPPEEYVETYRSAGADMIVAHGAGMGLVIDVEMEEVFGAPGLNPYIPGRPNIPFSLGRMARMMKVADIPFCGVGGIYKGVDALQYLLLGCSAVGMSSAVFLGGYGAFKVVIDGIREWMMNKGYSTPKEFIGKAKKSALFDVSRFIELMELPIINYQPNLQVQIMPSPEEKTSPVIPTVDPEKCSLCDLCTKTCLFDVYEKRDDKIVVNDLNTCWGCGLCVGICPQGAIRMIDKETGETLWGNKGTAKPYKELSQG